MDFRQARGAMGFNDLPERGARFDGLQLVRIADEHQLCAEFIHPSSNPRHLSRADHASFVDDKDIAL